MCITDRHDMTLPVKVVLNPITANQPIIKQGVYQLVSISTYASQAFFSHMMNHFVIVGKFIRPCSIVLSAKKGHRFIL